MQKHIYCSANITAKMHDVFVSYILSQTNVTEYVLYLTSPGGNPAVGFNLYAFMKARSEKTTVYNMSNVDSAAVQFFLGFEHRYGTPNCTFMVHPTTFSKDFLPQQYSAFDARMALNQIDSIEKKTVDIIVSETSKKASTVLTPEQIQSAMFQTTIVDAQNALKYGIIEKILDPVLPASDVLYLTENYLEKL